MSEDTLRHRRPFAARGDALRTNLEFHRHLQCYGAEQFRQDLSLAATTLTNTVTASADLPSYLDFYLMVDVSGSMGCPRPRPA